MQLYGDGADGVGADAVAFYMSANVGEALKPMNKVASGGELARIMLALKNVLAQQDRVDTLIFDEVDTGVSGGPPRRWRRSSMLWPGTSRFSA